MLDKDKYQYMINHFRRGLKYGVDKLFIATVMKSMKFLQLKNLIKIFKI